MLSTVALTHAGSRNFGMRHLCVIESHLTFNCHHDAIKPGREVMANESRFPIAHTVVTNDGDKLTCSRVHDFHGHSPSRRVTQELRLILSIFVGTNQIHVMEDQRSFVCFVLFYFVL